MEIKTLFLDKYSGVSHFSNKMNGMNDDTLWLKHEINDNASWPRNGNKEKTMAEYRLAVFSELVDDRKNYLNQLLDLPGNWLSGESNIPNQYAIDMGKKILGGFLEYLKLKKEYVFIPKVIMGPIPSGGISIELHRNSEIALYFNIFNNKDIEIEAKYFGFYSDIEIKNINEGLLPQYDLFIEESTGNSGWGNPVSVCESKDFP
jgi:hypothetical protein